MKNVMTVMLAACTLTMAAGIANATLPPPTEEEKAAAQAKKEAAAKEAEIAKQNLEKAQDRTVQHYKQRKPQQAAKADTGASGDKTHDVPSAQLQNRPLERAGAYNEGVTPQSAPSATQGTKSDSSGDTPKSSN